MNPPLRAVSDVDPEILAPLPDRLPEMPAVLSGEQTGPVPDGTIRGVHGNGNRAVAERSGETGIAAALDRQIRGY